MSKIIHYRNKCIGCGICVEQQPAHWRMSKKDGKATLLKSIPLKAVHILIVRSSTQQETQEIAKLCPVKIIKLS